MTFFIGATYQNVMERIYRSYMIRNGCRMQFHTKIIDPKNVYDMFDQIQCSPIRAAIARKHYSMKRISFHVINSFSKPMNIE